MQTNHFLQHFTLREDSMCGHLNNSPYRPLAFKTQAVYKQNSIEASQL